MSNKGKNKAIEVCNADASSDMNADNTNPVVLFDKIGQPEVNNELLTKSNST